MHIILYVCICNMYMHMYNVHGEVALISYIPVLCICRIPNQEPLWNAKYRFPPGPTTRTVYII